MAVGRKRRITTFQQSQLRRVKNLGVRRTKVSLVHRDLRKLATQEKNKRLK